MSEVIKDTMNHKPEFANTSLQDLRFYPIYLALFLFACVFTLLFINLVGNRWAYYDIGINTVTRSWTLFFFIAPIVFTGLIGGAALSSYLILRHHKPSGKRLLLTGIVSMVIVFVIVFLLDVWRTIDYPNPFNRNLLDFLNYYVTQWLK